MASWFSSCEDPCKMVEIINCFSWAIVTWRPLGARCDLGLSFKINAILLKWQTEEELFMFYIQIPWSLTSIRHFFICYRSKSLLIVNKESLSLRNTSSNSASKIWVSQINRFTAQKTVDKTIRLIWKIAIPLSGWELNSISRIWSSSQKQLQSSQLANGTILKTLATHPSPKFGRWTPLPRAKIIFKYTHLLIHRKGKPISEIQSWRGRLSWRTLWLRFCHALPPYRLWYHCKRGKIANNCAKRQAFQEDWTKKRFQSNRFETGQQNVQVYQVHIQILIALSS